MPVARPAERIGTVIGGRYRIERIVGAGGMGVVFAGRHTWTERPVAVKVLSIEYLEDEMSVRRFLREAKTAAKVSHANVVDVLDMGETRDGAPFLVLELLEGESLEARLARGALPQEDALAHLLPIMDALAHAHAAGVLHRDIKPANLFLHRDAKGNLVPKIVDFGISKLVEATVSMPTATGTMLGTPHYMSPEQVNGLKTIGEPADVWSIGVVLFEALAGRRPFEGTGALAVVTQILNAPVPALRDVAPHVHEAIAEVVDEALQKSVEDRCPSMGELIDRLLRAGDAAGIEVADPRVAHLSIPPKPGP